jgi:hypothetical protein
MSKWSTALALSAAPLALVSLGSLHAELRADAPTPTVVLLRGSAPDEVTTEATARVKGELKAAGFDVAVFALSGSDARRDLETAGRELNPIAAFAIFVKPSREGTAVAEIWVSDRIRQKTIIQNAILADRDRGRGAEILAVRAVELLKASLADVWTSTARASASAASSGPASAAGSSAPTAASRATASADREEASDSRPAFASGVGIGLGAGVLQDFGAQTTTWAPEAQVSYGWPEGLSLRATFQGLGPAATFSADAGTAKVEEQLAIVEAVKTWWPRAPVVPFVCAGAGVQHTHITGAASSPYQGHVLDLWSPLASLGMGLAIPLFADLSLLAQARAVGVWPTVVQINQMDAGRISALSLLADGGILGVFP